MWFWYGQLNLQSATQTHQVVSCQIGHCHHLNYCLITPGGSQPNWHLFKCYNLAYLLGQYCTSYLIWPFPSAQENLLWSLFSTHCQRIELVQMVCEYQLCWLLWHYIINTLVIGDLQDWTEMRVLPVCCGGILGLTCQQSNKVLFWLIDTISYHRPCLA